MVNGEPRYESIDEARSKDEFLRQAYMGHQKWILVSNEDNMSFEEKIKKTKESVMDVIGKSAGTYFHKKLLLQKITTPDKSAIPLDFSKIKHNVLEEILITETFLNYQS